MAPRLPVYYRFEPIDFDSRIDSRNDGTTADGMEEPRTIKARGIDGRQICVDLGYGVGVEIHDSITLDKPELLNSLAESASTDPPPQSGATASKVLTKSKKTRRLVMAKSFKAVEQTLSEKETIPESSPPILNSASKKVQKLRHDRQVLEDEDEEVVPETPTAEDHDEHTLQPEIEQRSGCIDEERGSHSFDLGTDLDHAGETLVDIEMGGTDPEEVHDAVELEPADMEVEGSIGAVHTAEEQANFQDPDIHMHDEGTPEAEQQETPTGRNSGSLSASKTSQKRIDISEETPTWEDENPRKRVKRVDAPESVLNRRPSSSRKPPVPNPSARHLQEVEDSDQDEDDSISVGGFTPLNIRRPSHTRVYEKRDSPRSLTSAKSSTGRAASPEIETSNDLERDPPTFEADEPAQSNTDDTDPLCWYCHTKTTDLHPKIAGGRAFLFCTNCHQEYDKDKVLAKKVRQLAWEELGSDPQIPKFPLFDKENSESVEPSGAPVARTETPPASARTAGPTLPINAKKPFPIITQSVAATTVPQRTSHQGNPPTAEQQKQHQELQNRIRQLQQLQQRLQGQIQQTPQQQIPEQPGEQNGQMSNPQLFKTATSEGSPELYDARKKSFRLFRYDAPERYLTLTELDIADKRSRSKFSMIKLKKVAWKNFMFDSDREQFWFNYTQLLEGRDDLNKYARRANSSGEIVIVPGLPGGRYPDIFLQEQERRRQHALQLGQMHPLGFNGPFGPIPILYQNSIHPNVLTTLPPSGFSPLPANGMGPASTVSSPTRPDTSPATPCPTGMNAASPLAEPRPEITKDRDSTTGTASTQSAPVQPVSTQSAPVQSVSTQSVPVQSVSTQSVAPLPQPTPQPNMMSLVKPSTPLPSRKAARKIKPNTREQRTEGRASVERDVDILLRAATAAIATGEDEDGNREDVASASVPVGKKIPAKMRSKSYAALKQTIESATPRQSLPSASATPDASSLPRPLPYRKPVSTGSTPASAGPSTSISPVGPAPQMPPAFRPTHTEKSAPEQESVPPQQPSDVTKNIVNALGSGPWKSSERTIADKNAETPDETVMRRIGYVQNSHIAAAQGRYAQLGTPTKTPTNAPIPKPISLSKPATIASPHASIIAALQSGNPAAFKQRALAPRQTPPAPKTPNLNTPTFTTPTPTSQLLSTPSTRPSREKDSAPRVIDKASFEEVLNICARKLNEASNIGRPLRLMLTNPDKSSGPPPAMGGILSFEQNVNLAKLLHRVCTRADDTLKDRPDLLAFSDVAAKMRSIPKDYGPYIAAEPIS